MVQRRAGRGRGVAVLGVFGAALWLGVGGLFAVPAAQAATGGCAGLLVKTLPAAAA